MNSQSKQLLVLRCFANNAPDYWIVTDKAWKGNIIATCSTELEAQAIAKATGNSHA